MTSTERSWRFRTREREERIRSRGSVEERLRLDLATEIVTLKMELRDARAEIDRLKTYIADLETVQEVGGGSLQLKNYRLILGCLHPDNVPNGQSKARYEAAFKAFKGAYEQERNRQDAQHYAAEGESLAAMARRKAQAQKRR